MDERYTYLLGSMHGGSTQGFQDPRSINDIQGCKGAYISSNSNVLYIPTGLLT